MSKTTEREPEDGDLHDSDSLDSNIDSSSDSEWLPWADEIFEVKLSNMKYAANFSVTINNNNGISLFDTGTTISYMSKACFDKLDPKPVLVPHTHIQSKWYQWQQPRSSRNHYMYLEFPQKFQQQLIVCKHLLCPVILGLDFSHNYLIGNDWFSTNQLHLPQGPWSISLRTCTVSFAC